MYKYIFCFILTTEYTQYPQANIEYPPIVNLLHIFSTVNFKNIASLKIAH